jgi:CDP-6-deoxy-D-xylo-4-hexulose-3-dehydrase
LSIRSHGWDRDLSPSVQQELRKKHNVTDFNSLYTFYYDGFNVRATDLQAYIGLGQLDKLDDICKKRNKNFIYLQENIKNDFWKPVPIDGTFTSNFCYPIIHPKRDKIVEALKNNLVEVRPLVCGSMGSQPFYTSKYGQKILKNCDIVDKFGLYIPNNPDLTKEELDLMITVINDIITN